MNQPGLEGNVTTTTVESLTSSINWTEVANKLVSTWVLLSFIYTIILILRCTGKMIFTLAETIAFGARLIWKLLRVIWKTIVGQRGSRQFGVVIILLLWIVMPARSCSDIASIQTKDHVCIQGTGGTEHCQINTISIINVRPNGSVACFKVQDPESNVIVETVEVKILGVTSICQQRTHFYAREFELHSEYSHRCAGAGSCVDARCSKVKAEDNIEELSQHAKSSPGYTSCFEGCGCVSCAWCWRCDSSCLFHRSYATPSTSDVQEVFTCPTWITMVEVEIHFDGHTFKEEIHHGIPHPIPESNITITITNFVTPPSPLHGATYIKQHGSDGIRTGFAYTSIAPSGHPSKGFIGELQCATFKDAEEFKCVFDRTLCPCLGQGTYVDCLCKRLSLNELLEKNEIPTAEGTTQIYMHEGELRTSTTTSALVALQIEFRNQTVTRIGREDVCEATIQEVSGCFACAEGGKIHISCKSENEKINGVLYCPTFIGFITCGPSTESTEVAFSSTGKEVSFQCSLSCGKNKTIIQVSGALKEETKFQADLYHNSPTNRNNRFLFENPIATITKAGRFITNFIQSILQSVFWTLITVISIGLVLSCCLPASAVSRWCHWIVRPPGVSPQRRNRFRRRV